MVIDAFWFYGSSVNRFSGSQVIMLRREPDSEPDNLIMNQKNNKT